MPRLRRVARMCSSNLSDAANMSRHGSTLCSPTVEKILCRSPISKRSHVGNLRQTKKQRETGVKRVETVGVYPLAPPRGAANPRLRRRRTPLAEVQRKTSRPLGANRLRGSCAPDNRCRKRCCPDRAYCCATRVLSIVCAEKEAQILLLRKKSALFLAKERQK